VNDVRDQGHDTTSSWLKRSDFGSDFGITPISIPGGTINVKNEIKTDIDTVTLEREAAAFRLQ
jgi:hypothetical protein